jgi:hypothetical protein
MVSEKFHEWLDEAIYTFKDTPRTRRELCINRGVNLGDLEWAFTFGWMMGQEEMCKDMGVRVDD